ncbi:MAG: hypothetical protein R2939_15995 [Kofleriaceae bacterium]
MSARPTLAAVVIAWAAAGGCGAAAPPVVLDGSWPAPTARASVDDATDAYAAQTAAWTRHATLRRGYREVLTVDATLLAPPWRVAHAERAAALSGQPVAPLLEAERAADDEAYAVQLLLTTWERRENNLDQGERATWQVALIAEDGTVVPARRVARDKRPRTAIAAEFPTMGDFAQAYVAYFPRELALLGPSTREVRLRLHGTQGAVELRWQQPR